MNTRPREPKLRTEERAKMYPESKPNEDENLCVNFKARKMPDFSKYSPLNFSMRKSEDGEQESQTSHGTITNPPHLHTLERAERRKEIDKQYQEKKKKDEEEQKLTEEEKEIEAKKELQRLRQELEFKVTSLFFIE